MEGPGSQKAIPVGNRADIKVGQQINTGQGKYFQGDHYRMTYKLPSQKMKCLSRSFSCGKMHSKSHGEGSYWLVENINKLINGCLTQTGRKCKPALLI